MNIHPARERDQPAIERIVREARINPFDLDWHHFIVAEEKGEIIGVGQIKTHTDGSRELASIAVIPSQQRQGLGGEIVRTLMARETGTLYLMCQNSLEGYYARFGFSKIERDEMPPYFRKMHRLANLFVGLAHGTKIIVMKK